MQNLNHSHTCQSHFPALQVVCPFLLRALIGCQWLKPLFFSAVVINLVLSFRHALIKTVATDEARYLRKKCPAVFGHHLHRFENKFNGIVRHKIRQIETNKTWPKKSEKKFIRWWGYMSSCIEVSIVSLLLCWSKRTWWIISFGSKISKWRLSNL